MCNYKREKRKKLIEKKLITIRIYLYRTLHLQEKERPDLKSKIL